MRSGFCASFLFLTIVAALALPRRVRAVDPLSDAAVTAVSQATDPRRLELLSDAAFRAQLGPALGWLHVARRRDVAPEAVIARAFVLNGLAGERARLTREALLRNLARADSWELFAHDDTALALAAGRPAQIPTGVHRGHLAQAAVVVPEGLTTAESRREFACLVLRADDEMPYAPPPRRRQRGDMIARNAAGQHFSPPVSARPRPARPVNEVSAAPEPNAVPVSYDDPLPSL